MAHDTLVLRSLVTSQNAGVIIGKAGRRIADLRKRTGVEAAITEFIHDVPERVLVVTGPVDGVVRAYTLIIFLLAANDQTSGARIVPSSSSIQNSIRLLISHNLMGSIIGRKGLKIQAIQAESGARLVVSNDMLPQSNERVVQVEGAPEAIGNAIGAISRALVADWERDYGTIVFRPSLVSGVHTCSVNHAPPPLCNIPRRTNTYAHRRSVSRPASPLCSTSCRRNAYASPLAASPPQSVFSRPEANLETQSIAIPPLMAGGIIGWRGTKITEMRRLSGSSICIANAPREGGERMVTISGTPKANEKALFLLYSQLERERHKFTDMNGSNEHSVWGSSFA
ncbi:hypothetical protein C8R47DRAFT_1181270 [Mycena vitilis]|nr:hypothetical protein C8R47DRAFT_1181270 [Mycena vitilis]